MNKYKELIDKHQKEVNNFPIMFAFNDEQFKKGMIEVLGLKPGEIAKIYSIGGGGFIRKEDSSLMNDMLVRHTKEIRDEIEKDLDGSGFIKDMFKYELANHEFCITYDYEEVLNTLGLTEDEVCGNGRLLKGLALAKKEYLEECNI